MRPFPALFLLVLTTHPALAQDQPDYLDDRSTPEAVIDSYYSAINRFEYARAYSYFGEAAPPNYDSWEMGYSDTQKVIVSYGPVSEEGAAGSTFYSVPVLLDVERTEGQHAWFSGCYFLRLTQPAIQGVPFQPMHIHDAKLTEVKAGADTSPPASCEQP